MLVRIPGSIHYFNYHNYHKNTRTVIDYYTKEFIEVNDNDSYDIMIQGSPSSYTVEGLYDQVILKNKDSYMNNIEIYNNNFYSKNNYYEPYEYNIIRNRLTDLNYPGKRQEYYQEQTNEETINEEVQISEQIQEEVKEVIEDISSSQPMEESPNAGFSFIGRRGARKFKNTIFSSKDF